jgi:molybdate transport system permease protein
MQPPDASAPPRLVVLLAGVAVVFLALPLLGLLARAPWSRVGAILASGVASEALKVSLIVSVGALVGAMVLGFPLAWVLARTRFRGQALVRALVVLPLVLPPVVGGVGLLAALGRRGVLGSWLEPVGITLPFTTFGAVLAAMFVSFPLFTLTVEAGLRALDPRYELAAQTLGASGGYTFRRVMLPLLRPQIVAGAVLTWARALGEFGATITFAGNLPGRTQTLPLAVFEIFQTDLEASIMVSLLLVGLSAGVLVLLRGRVLAAG